MKCKTGEWRTRTMALICPRSDYLAGYRREQDRGIAKNKEVGEDEVILPERVIRMPG